MQKTYKYRYIAQIDVEAASPLVIGSGRRNVMTDALVATDVNNLPYIPGTSIAGVIRSFFRNGGDDSYFGFQDEEGGEGSKLVFSEGRLIGEDGKPVDGLANPQGSSFLSKFISLPIRQHVRITSSGTGARGGKFDEQVVMKGARFRFEIELMDDKDSAGTFKRILETLYDKGFRLGGGSRSGFGQLIVVDCFWRAFDLSNLEDLQRYLAKSSSLRCRLDGEKFIPESKEENNWVEYSLTLSPSDFFLFGSGVGSKDADITALSEKFVSWKNGIPGICTANVVIPASSVKGALSHRTAFHYNRLTGYYLDSIPQAQLGNVGDNKAVRDLFGSSTKAGQIRGNVLMSDVIEKSEHISENVNYHVCVDRFTGGVRKGALFQEAPLYGDGYSCELKIYVLKSALNDVDVVDSFENALKDLCEGRLSLGGGGNRGNGCFYGRLYADGELKN